jgi:hypothetical protein
MDLPDVQARWPEIQAELIRHGVEEPMAISAAAQINLQPLLWRAVHLLESAPEPKAVEEMPVYRPPEDPADFTIEEGGRWLAGARHGHRALGVYDLLGA